MTSPVRHFDYELVNSVVRSCECTHRVSDLLQILKDGFDLRSLARFFVPAPLGDLPDRWAYSQGIMVLGLLWSPALKDQREDNRILEIREGDFSCHELEMEPIRAWVIHLRETDIPQRRTLTGNTHPTCLCPSHHFGDLQGRGSDPYGNAANK